MAFVPQFNQRTAERKGTAGIPFLARGNHGTEGPKLARIDPIAQGHYIGIRERHRLLKRIGILFVVEVGRIGARNLEVPQVVQECLIAKRREHGNSR
jgi:hypothetical protein